MGKGQPTPSPHFPRSHDAMLFGAAMLQLTPMIDGEIGIEARSGSKRRS